ncbi:CRISPR-associated endonuclease Cas2 [Candidatus Daviesbacteria bacterium RIFCSPLOWO2_01_FULL_38_10]|uniref:Transcriptional regulator, PaaX family n=1 Tax=Candidatus Daviesbacteria bacterium GW2011_GWF2_38_6 TaxID=1618432 RepID=A0A0G0KH62_9BACT|nr:MAG: Transcriptional regulator, PaaX family [Candidatus Daviesbacteria bacterium GW2011_GWA2_38_17]KKQ78968.1 MAG: Transcriptional regulator, PaaX family [Candidatus Daviesbacteria bacterium GW2011_GWF2_38_6]OGE27858.1 MAG: CRISPR-associated endonuclease Cas2 [Candidatus Daviesbacteria bacterium RIFCSPHIGHO2_02_FULL_39_41]OGE38968.1 MAG: CRISPR-associated endonuclease Cas2 [Candidatus Daviesbacteria bacterium RIFCSPLOWO2_01_FULL_38_10]OGE45054.1 MAG: CRISPR-associated endonuclease Cas2 [Cand
MKIRRNSLNYFLLFALEKSIDGVAYFDQFVNNPGYWAYGTGKDFDKPVISQAIKRLREKGYLETSVDEGKVMMKLTELGADALGFVDQNKPWDKKWRIVIYDIPEDKRGVRDLFRRRLKEWGFKKWQQSTWITKKDVTEKLRKLVKKLGITNWVAIIESADPAISNIIDTAV